MVTPTPIFTLLLSPSRVIDPLPTVNIPKTLASFRTNKESPTYASLPVVVIPVNVETPEILISVPINLAAVATPVIFQFLATASS